MDLTRCLILPAFPYPVLLVSLSPHPIHTDFESLPYPDGCLIYLVSVLPETPASQSELVGHLSAVAQENLFQRDSMMVQKGYMVCRNGIWNSEFGVFPGCQQTVPMLVRAVGTACSQRLGSSPVTCSTANQACGTLHLGQSPSEIQKSHISGRRDNSIFSSAQHC